MNRLALNHVLRAAHLTQRPCPARLARVSLQQQPRRFASTNRKTTVATTVTPPSVEFERLFASLKPELSIDELSRRVAALFLMTDKSNEIEQVEKRLNSIIKGHNLNKVTERIKFFIQNPPKELVETGQELLTPPWLNAEAQSALSEADLSAFEYMSTLMETDPCVKLMEKLDEPTSESIEHDWIAFKERGEIEALERLLQFFSRNGLEFVPPTHKSVAVVKRIKEQSKMDDTPVIPESELDLEDEDPVVRANIAARTSQNIFEPPPAPYEYPDLMQSDPLLDPKDVLDLPPTKDCPFHNKVIVRNHRSVFHDYNGIDDLEGPELVESVDEFSQALTVPKNLYEGLHQSVLIRRGVIQQTGKGKIRRVAYTVLLGNANGLVGIGEGKHANSMVALKSARLAAVRNMDWVERFEKRTVWTEMHAKLGGTELIIRPRPVGFGLRCNPYLHQILRAAGFKDISAKVWGSRNKLNVIKAAMRLLQAGHAPTGMGDGLGGPGKKLSKGSGLIGKQELERARGRKLVPLRK
ncbi:37S ribosomal protein S5 [Coprinopsis marcescibilis]|uniref:37S ribosomal protein S5 n=1 Tax=Coprinopsis marcescibilis TaxID=230819 RepID=A0A5C3KXX7_COPMA|nr:37S ribosomal protein S5 [Coprinopsis marcescibilis]